MFIKNAAQARKVKKGDAYTIDVYPDPRLEDQSVTPDMLAERDRLEAIVQQSIKEKSSGKKEAK